MSQHVKFPSIESFANVYRNQAKLLDPKPCLYGGKVKLHGTNAGIRLENGTVTAQSRSRDLGLDDDNAGFAAFVSSTADMWQIETSDMFETVVFHGEWAGTGIQRNDAVTKIGAKAFFIFAIQVDDVMYTDPELIEGAVPEHPDVFVVPWHMKSDEPVTFKDHDAVQKWLTEINEEVEKIGVRDPYIYGRFGIEGPGEGLVFTPMTSTKRDEYSRLVFKAKTESHRVNKSANAAQTNIRIPDGVPEFLETFVTDARMEQAITEACDGTADKESTGKFLKWFCSDVMKESVAELEEMGLEWKKVAGFVNKKAARMYLDRCEKLEEAA